MKKNNNKKLVTFREKNLIDNMTNDEADVIGGSVSSIIEKYVMESMMPTNQNAACWVRLLYSDNTLDIGRTFDAIFGSLAAGINWQAKESNGQPLVEHFLGLLVYATPPIGDENEWPYINQQWDSIAKLLEVAATKNPDQAGELQTESEHAHELQKLIEDNPSHIRYTSLVGAILSNWEFLKNHTRTYRCLAAIARVQKGMTNTPEARYNLVQILKEVSKEWAV